MCKSEGCNIHPYASDCCSHIDADWGPYCLECIETYMCPGPSFGCCNCGHKYCEACGSEEECPKCGATTDLYKDDFTPVETCKVCGAHGTNQDKQDGCTPSHFNKHGDWVPALCGEHFVEYLARQGRTIYACKCLSTNPDNAIIWCKACGPKYLDVVCDACDSGPVMVHSCPKCFHVDMSDVLQRRGK